MSGLLERFATMSVLVVDDNAVNVALLQRLLMAEGMERVVGTTDPRDTEELLREVDPDLVLLDLHMPHLDGLTVLDLIVRYAAGSYLPVLVLTADTTSEARNEALSRGARDFVTKPFDLDEVTLRVANLLETRRLYDSLRPVPADRTVDSDGVRRRVQGVLDDGVLPMALQKVADTVSLDTVGHEALARFPQPHERGPAGWFGDAFEVGLGTQLEWLAIQQALQVLAAAPNTTFLALNMSPATVLGIPEHDLFPPAMCSRVVIELTEHVPVEDYGALHRALEDVRRSGARLAADDLGSGYAGFLHLIALEPDIIKLDISLVSGLHRSRTKRAMTSALVAFAADIGATVIAEGVEEAAELAALRDLGVPWAQGYYLGRPQIVGQDQRAIS